MSKPLELTAYPTFWLSGTLLSTAAPGVTIVEPIDVDYWAACKRLTDAELAAIYWGFVQTDMLWPDAGADPDETDPDYWDAACTRWQEAEETVHRFATLPHYDEDQP